MIIYNMPEINKSFGETVRRLRSEMGWSQEKLAEYSDLDRTYIGGIERGERNPSLRNISKIAKALRVKISKLFQLGGE